MTLQDLQEFREILDGWFDTLPPDLSRKVLDEMGTSLEMMGDPRMSEELSEIRESRMVMEEPIPQEEYKESLFDLEQLRILY